jgi:hypothetical protein
MVGWVKLIQVLEEGVPARIVKDSLIALEVQQTELRARLTAGSSTLLDPYMADLYRDTDIAVHRGGVVSEKARLTLP